MAQVLSAASAFNPGNDLWIVPDADNSRWVLKLDWYLNFQIQQAGRHAPSELSGGMNELLGEIDWPAPQIPPQKKNPLMISVDSRLPARWLVVVPHPEPLSDWIARLLEVWGGLRKPSLRVFLPTGLPAGRFNEEWKRHSHFDDMTLVLDQDSRAPDA
ncbi:MAG: hypothetical protein KF802_13870 [Bdellovibrionaceae bacterium]|nr:hypothetical protein [Pseudobdellovibrionaceae bacterium]MBX3033116.1 hypothetical protein [Pseudobdellovibrionaceae bacterium]